MTDFGGRFPVGGVRRTRFTRFRAWVLFAVPLAAILFQVYVPLFLEFLSYLELPLLVTVYFAVTRRHPIHGVFIGASIGLVQDSLSHQPLGMFGIVKTIVGYASASVGTRFEAEHPVVRFVIGFGFFLFHHFSYWLLRRLLLGQQTDPEIQRAFLLALLNGMVAVPLFYLLDKLREEG